MGVNVIKIEGTAIRYMFSVDEDIHESCWAQHHIDITTQGGSGKKLVLDDGTGSTAYMGVILSNKHGDAFQASGMVDFVVKTCNDEDWENATIALSSGPIDIAYTLPGELIFMAPFVSGKYSEQFRLYYRVEDEELLKNACFYTYISNEAYSTKHLSFV